MDAWLADRASGNAPGISASRRSVVLMDDRAVCVERTEPVLDDMMTMSQRWFKVDLEI
jgi:hypothetical protein